MPRFPTKEVNINSLGFTMLTGFYAHTGDFPSVDKMELMVALRQYQTVRDEKVDMQAAVQQATETKKQKLAALEKLMKNLLKKSTVDTANTPEKLALIGWGPKALSQPARPPQSPNNLRSVNQGSAGLELIFDSPAAGSAGPGGPIRNYIIQRRQQPESGGEFGSWSIAATTLTNRISLSDQPTGLKLEYRAKAVNTAGESMPSNTIAAIL